MASKRQVPALHLRQPAHRRIEDLTTEEQAARAAIAQAEETLRAAQGWLKAILADKAELGLAE